MNQMKILHVIPYFYPAWAYGGPPRNAYGLCRELAKRGHEVTVFTTDALDGKNRIKEKEETADGITIRRFRNLNNYVAYRHRIFISIGMMGAMNKDLKNYDIVHLNEFRTLQNPWAHRCARKYGVPYVVQARGSLINVVAKQRLKSLFDAIGGRTLLRDASRLIALAPLEVEQYKSYGVDPGKIDIIPNGIDPAEYEHLPPRGTFRQKHGLQANQKVILFLGRLHQTKGIDLLINAFGGIVKDFNDARLVVAGPDDGYLPALQSLAAELGLAEKVIFTGALYGDEKLAAYTDADVYALTSSFEAFGISVFEALACGTPVVVTDRCGVADIVRDKAGLVVPYEAAGLEKALRRMLADDSLRQRYGKDGQALVRGEYGWGAIAEKMERVYEGVISKLTLRQAQGERGKSVGPKT
jgi:glycosyltransferase involved in cell wall biosynthesis